VLKVNEGGVVIDHWFALIDKRVATRGAIDTIKFVKLARLAYTRALCGHPLSQSDCLGVPLAKSGFPNLGKPFLKLMESGDINSLRLCHTLLSVTRSWKVKGQLDLSSIISPSTSNECDNLFYHKEVKAVMKDQGWKIPHPKWDKYHLTTKSGPNGLAMISSLVDLSLLSERQIDLIKIVAGSDLVSKIEHLKSVSVPKWIELFGLKPKWVLSKLSLIYDKEAKVRVVGILDYWTQTALRPLHLRLFSLLKRIKSDCTHNQDHFRLCLPPKGPYYSYDLTAATDRFPIWFEKWVVSELVNKEYGDAWAELIADRDFKSPAASGSIRYGVGQPMGAYSSWAVFALSHHVVVLIAAKRAGKPSSWSDYALLGDDIVIADTSVAEQYKIILSDLGVSISDTKSHVSKDTYEFAKRWIHLGEEVSGAPILIPTSTPRLKWPNAVSWIMDIEARWFSTVESFVTRSVFRELYICLGVNPGYSHRLARKCFDLYNLPLSRDKYADTVRKGLYFAERFYDNITGCNRIKMPMVLMWVTLADAKFRMLRVSIKKQTVLLNTFLSKISDYAGLVPEGMDAQSLLLSLVPVRCIIDNIKDMQLVVDKLRLYYTSNREKSIVLDSSEYRLSVNPESAMSARRSQLVLYQNAAIVNRAHQLAKLRLAAGKAELALPFEVDTDSV